MIEKMQDAVEAMINGTVGQVVDKIGYTSIGGGLGIGAVSQSNMTMPDWLPGSLATVATIFSIVGALTLIIKNVAEMHYSRKRFKRDQQQWEEQQRIANNGDNNK